MRRLRAEVFNMQWAYILSMEKTTPADLTAEELYQLLADNPSKSTFTPEDLDEVHQ